MNWLKRLIELFTKSPSEKVEEIKEKPKMEKLEFITNIECKNYNQRAIEDEIICIIIHHSGSLSPKGDLNYLSMTHDHKGNRIYAGYHYYIDLEGKPYQLMSDDKRAWHAGASILHGKTDKGGKSVNGISLGICLTGDGVKEFNDLQYSTLFKLVHKKKAQYQINPLFIVGHEHISPGRKIDPAPFDWDRLFRSIYHQ